MSAARDALPVLMVCHRVAEQFQMTRWATVAEALDAARELTPCGPLCCGAHTIVVPVGDGRIRVIDAERAVRGDIRAAIRGDPDAIRRLLSVLPPGPRRRDRHDH
jgi:hypothetical protein